MNSLLAVVRRLADSGSMVGRRDYALLLFYLLTGLRRSEVIGLRGKDVEVRDGTLVIRYLRKGGKFSARGVADPAAYEVLTAYLEAAGRGNVSGSERPLWTRHDRAGRPGAPLTSRAFVENLKGYAEEAGLSHLHLHQTRHTYARIVARRGGVLSRRRRRSTTRTKPRPASTSGASPSSATGTGARSPKE